MARTKREANGLYVFASFDIQALAGLEIVRLKKEGKEIRPIALYERVVFDLPVKEIHASPVMHKTSCQQKQTTQENRKTPKNDSTIDSKGNMTGEWPESDPTKLTEITDLEISNCPQLERIICSHNQLTELKINNCPNVNRIYCSHNQLKELDFTNLEKLEKLFCEDNPNLRKEKIKTPPTTQFLNSETFSEGDGTTEQDAQEYEILEKISQKIKDIPNRSGEFKRELNLEKSTELSPHTLRRSFTTYHAEQGVPLPLLQKILEKPKSQPLPAKPTIFSPTEKEEITSGQENGFLPIFEENSPKRAKNAILPESKNPKILIQNQPQNQPPIKNSSPPIETKKPISIEPNSLPKNTQKQLLPPISKQEQKNNECRVLSDKNCFELSQNQKKETILIAKIKELEEQLKQVQNENNNLRAENKMLKNLVSENQNPKALIQNVVENQKAVVKLSN
ncbi:24632_t:CDS:2 [Racocetra persica]|uniref:24632_t:CDS:1 n=1 Tax=Racocetra persica TaxID=160502 RepID=A0ACA9LE94_9GLOM|nr:24632_t:CDS:2 [Racocetra persica]